MPVKGDEIYFEFDPWELLGEERPKKGIREAKAKIAAAVLEHVYGYIGNGSSPVKNGKWKTSLSKDYKKEKRARGGSGIADMDLTGDMLSTLQIVNSGSGLKLRIKGKEASKADGHNNHSGKSRLPLRQFIPTEDGSFKRKIMDEIKAIIEEYEE